MPTYFGIADPWACEMLRLWTGTNGVEARLIIVSERPIPWGCSSPDPKPWVAKGLNTLKINYR